MGIYGLRLLAFALAATLVLGGANESATIFQRDEFNVAKYASLGDSFASGPSAGEPWDKTKCRRFDQAFGPQLSKADEIHGPKPMKFSFIACSGAKTKHIYDSVQGGSSGGGGKAKDIQARQLKGMNPDMVTLSIGGNDVKFSNVLDQCVYKFRRLNGCGGCTPSVGHNDCSKDCTVAMDDLLARINSRDFTVGVNKAIESVFKYAPRTRLFMLGYPRFWNAETEACDHVSFKTFCIDNSVLPLIRDRRQRMNELTLHLNARIRSIILSYRPPSGGSITYVDTDKYFEGHRFCEEGVDEPSYRNPNIWFYPFEYSVGNTLFFDGSEVRSGDCDALYDEGGDDGDYYACQMANAELEGKDPDVDLHKQPNNVHSSDENALSSSGELPEFLARIFHPTIKGMEGYKNALIDAYRSRPFPHLRVLPLGDSITKGSGSREMDGYRKILHNLLGNETVDFVGTLSHGDFPDEDHEGHSGERISAIKGYASRAVKARPNVILVLAGTNDLDKPTEPVEEAPARLSSLLDSLMASCPDAAILVAEIMINTRDNMQATVDAFNQKLHEIVEKKNDDGKHVMLVKTGDLLTLADLSDEKHPNNEGYRKLAYAWYDAIQEANNQGWIKKPVEPEVQTGVGLGNGGSNACKGNNWKKRGTVTPPLVKTWDYKGTRDFDGKLPWGKWIIWADVNGDGRDDYLAVQQDGSVHAAIFDESGTSVHVVKDLAGGIRGQSGDQVRFADIDGDGYADYIVQSDDGAATVSINTKNVGNDAEKRNFEEAVVIAKGVDGVSGDKIQYADINGDGRADYLIVYDGGAVTAYLNNGKLKFDFHGSVATGVGGVPGNRVRMMDIDGDGYADYVVFASPEEFPDGQPKSCKKTSDCDGYCEDGTKASCESGKCKCQKSKCEKTSDCLNACPDNKTFYCSPESHTCKCYKPAGYIPFYPDQDCKTAKDCTQGCETDIDFGFECTDGRCACRKAAIDKWTEDRCVPEDNCKAECEGYELAQCLVTPENDEWVCACTTLTDPKSKTKRDASNEPVSYLRNTRKLSVRAGDGNWESPITIAPGVSEVEGSVHFAKFNKDTFPDYLVVTHSSTPKIGIYQGTGTLDKENSLRLADLDGDGKDDYIVVRSDGSVDAWLNKGANNLKPLANLAAPNNKDITPNKVHFADVNGDGKADYLVIWDGGSVDGYINTGNLNKDDNKRNWEPSHTIAPGLNGVTGDKIRFADVNGDGKADLCVLYNGGAVEAYLNTGVLNKDPNKRSWRPLPGVFAEGVNGVPGSKVRLADLDGDGLADYLVLYDGGAADAFHNTGNLADDPSARNFDDWGTVAGGVNGVSGAQVRFADLTGDGKADYVVINKDGSIDLIENMCGG